MAHRRRRQAHTAGSDPEPNAVLTGRRDSDWGGQPRTHQEDVAWAAHRAAVTVAAATIRVCDGGTGAHSDDVVHLCDAIADELGVYGNGRAELLAAAQLHDIGKVSIPHDVLNKNGPLDEHEWGLIREHTVAGEEIVRSVPELREVARLVRHSHERWDGGGYPDGLASEAIPLGSRIVFCADAFHAIRSDRPYRQGRTASASLEEVRRNAGTQFDPAVVAALVESAARIGDDDARRGGKGLMATLRTRRLAALLLTLTVSGSALAAATSGLFGRGDHDSKKAFPALRSAYPTEGSSSAPSAARRAAAAEQVRRQAARTARTDASSRSRGGALTRSTNSTPTAPRAVATASPARARQPAAVPPAPPQIARPTSPGRSAEAPRRPAQPGRPAGSTGRSAEAPGKPGQPVAPARGTPPEGAKKR